VDLVNRYAAALSLHPTPVEAVGEVAGELLERFDGERPDLLVCFASPHHVGAFEDIAAGLGKLLEPEALVGTTAVAVAGGAREIEDGPALSAFAAGFGAGRVDSFALDAMETDEGFVILGWPDAVAPRGTLLLLADPFTFPVSDFLRLLNAQLPELTVVGGLASAAAGPGGNRLARDTQVLSSGAVAVLCSEDVPVRAVVSQGCRPLGQAFTVTRAERNLVYELAGAPAVRRLQDLVLAADDAEREMMRHGLHLGVVVDEHRDEFGRGDFLVRNLLGVDKEQGALAVGERLEVGQTVQFQVRDAAAADEDLRLLLQPVRGEAALLFTCNGRGTRFFGTPDHDAAVIDELLDRVPLAGGFCAGEIGPIGGRNFLHGFTASVAVFGAGATGGGTGA
jgi:small ligand-binding sensory domain FIST